MKYFSTRDKSKSHPFSLAEAAFAGLAPDGGLFIWGTVKNCTDSSPLIQKFIEKKVAVVPGATFMCDTSATSPCFRLNYSTPSDEQIVEGIRRLGEAFTNL